MYLITQISPVLKHVLQNGFTEFWTFFKQCRLFNSWYFIKGLQIQDLDPRIKQMYEGVRDVLSKYRSGKLPKAFKIIPNLCNWEQVLYVTGMEYLHFSEVWQTIGLSSTIGVYYLLHAIPDPTAWSAAAMYQATRIFTSNLKEKMAQRFFNLVLLPRVRDDIAEYKRLNFHLYQALRKALFKPGAFMKGFLLPLCEVNWPYPTHSETVRTKKIQHI